MYFVVVLYRITREVNHSALLTVTVNIGLDRLKIADLTQVFGGEFETRQTGFLKKYNLLHPAFYLESVVLSK